MSCIHFNFINNSQRKGMAISILIFLQLGLHLPTLGHVVQLPKSEVIPQTQVSTTSERLGLAKCPCGQRRAQSQRIVGGQLAEINEFPWRCALFIEDRRNKSLRYYCSCSLISSGWVMTAAHCTDPNRRAKLLVSLGDHDLSTVSETRNEVVEVEQVRQHEQFNRRTLNNDISLLKLKTPAKVDDQVSPICLPFAFTGMSLDGKNGTVSGWGKTREGFRVKPTILHKVDLSIISPASCRRYWKRTQITDQMLCTLKKGKDACQGDSGSSLDYFEPASGRSYAVGVVSFGRGCGRPNSPGVFTRVTQMLDWIQRTSGEQFCTT